MSQTIDSTAEAGANQPIGELLLQTVAMPKETNTNGDIFGGWLLSQMDIAGGVMAERVASGRTVTVAISSMAFIRPVPVGAIISCYGELLSIGRSSIKLMLAVWCQPRLTGELHKVTEGEFVFVAIDEAGSPRQIARS